MLKFKKNIFINTFSLFILLSISFSTLAFIDGGGGSALPGSAVGGQISEFFNGPPAQAVSSQQSSNIQQRLVTGENPGDIWYDEMVIGSDRIDFTDKQMYGESYSSGDARQKDLLGSFPKDGTPEQKEAYLKRIAEDNARYEFNKQNGMTRDQAQSLFYDDLKNTSNLNLQQAGQNALNYFTRQEANPGIIGTNKRSSGDLLSLTMLKYIQIATGFISIVAFALVLYAGIRYMINPLYGEKKKALDIIKWTVIGMILIAFAYTITTSYINQILSI